MLVAVVVVVAVVAAYFFVANNSKLWPFANKSVATTQTGPQSSIKIEKVDLTGEKGKEVMNVKLKLDSKDTGYCVLTMSSKSAGLNITIDESKTKQDAKSTTAPKYCVGWSLGTAGFPNGTFKLDVKFVGSKTQLTTSDTVTLQNR